MQAHTDLQEITEDFTDLTDCIDLHKTLIQDWVFLKQNASGHLSTEANLAVHASTLEALRKDMDVIKSIIARVERENSLGVERLVKTEESTSMLDREEEVKIADLQFNINTTRTKLVAKENEIQKLEQQCSTLDGVAATLAFNQDKVGFEHEVLCLSKLLRRLYRLAKVARTTVELTAKQQTTALKHRSRVKSQLYKQAMVSSQALFDNPVSLPQREALEDLFGISLNVKEDSSDDEDHHVINLLPSIDPREEEVIVHKDFQSAYEVALLERITNEEKRDLTLQLKELRLQHQILVKKLSGRKS